MEVFIISPGPWTSQSRYTVKPVYSGHNWGPATVLIIEVSLFQRFIYTLVVPLLTVLIIEVSLFQSVHNSRFDCMAFGF